MTFLIEKINEFLQPLYNYLLEGLSSSIDKNIIDGDLLRINLSWSELPCFITCLITILLIYLFILFVVKLLGIFVWK